MNLLLVSTKTEQSKGGIAVWTDSFLKHCDAFDISCDLLNIATIGKRAVQGNAKRNLSDEICRTRNIFSNLSSMMRSKKYNVAHVNTSCGAFGLIRDYLTVCKIKKKQPSCKVILHFHCDIQNQCRSKYSRSFLLRILKKADEILVLNKRNHSYLYDNYGISSVIVPNFIDDNMVRKETKSISAQIKEALFVGYVRPEKGIKELYEVARKTSEIHFRLIGEVHNEVLTWDKPENVFLLGKKDRDSILQSLDEADIFFFPSHGEGFSIALLEAMARALPCIATDVGANEEMLENKGGIIVPVKDIEAMTAAFELVNTPRQRESMSLWNVEKVRNNYTSSAVFKDIVESYM